MSSLFRSNKFLFLMILIDAGILGFANDRGLSAVALGFLLLVVSPLLAAGVVWIGRRLEQGLLA